MNEELQNELLSLPEKIKEQRLTEMTARLNRTDAEKELELLKAEIQQTVSGETDPEGKRIYSNESSRKAEVKRRIEESTEASKMESDISEYLEAGMTAEIEADYFKDRLRAIIAVSESEKE